MAKNFHSITILLILNAIIVNVTVVNEFKRSPRIVGGSSTTISQAKFIVNLRIRNQFICGGSLVTPNYVITAAHCVYNIKPSQLTVVGGATYLKEEGVRRSVIKVVIPRDYNRETQHMDIAVLKLNKVITDNKISTITLCNSTLKTNDYIQVYGWGCTQSINFYSGYYLGYKSVDSEQLREVSLPLVNQSECIGIHKRRNLKITNSMFCAGSWKGKDSCTGDSGGPAVFKSQLCGIVSWGIGCGLEGLPGVYTNIKYARDFINRNIKI